MGSKGWGGTRWRDQTVPKNKERFQPTDVYVGKRIRTRRMQMGMSQEKLGDELGITFQQVQKYEKGTNRVSASKLQVLANVFKVPVAFFFEGGPAEGGNGRRNASPEFTFANLLSTSDGVALCTAFEKIENKAVRRMVVNIAETLAAHQ
jgi:transcriptional regulator with XRE-family HTH domain